MAENNAVQNELQRLQMELLRFLTDSAALGALDATQVQLSKRVVDAISSQVDSLARNSVARELAEVREVLSRDIRDRASSRDTINRTEPPPLVSAEIRDDEAPVRHKSRREHPTELAMQRPATRSWHQWLLLALPLLLFGGILGSLWQLNQTQTELTQKRKWIIDHCAVEQKLRKRLNSGADTKVSAPEVNGEVVPLPVTDGRLASELLNILNKPPRCPDLKGGQTSQ